MNYAKYYLQTRSEIIFADYINDEGKTKTFGFIFYDPLARLSLIEKVQFVTTYMDKNYCRSCEGYSIPSDLSRRVKFNPKIRIAPDNRCFISIADACRKEGIRWEFFYSSDSVFPIGEIPEDYRKKSIDEVLSFLSKNVVIDYQG